MSGNGIQGSFTDRMSGVVFEKNRLCYRLATVRCEFLLFIGLFAVVRLFDSQRRLQYGD